MDNQLEPVASAFQEKQQKSLLALAAWASLIFVLSVIPVPEFAPGKFIFFSFDTFAHAAFYVPLGALILWAFPRGQRGAIWARAALGALAFGFMIELIQAFIPWRSFEWTDAIADLTGGVTGATFALFFPRIYLLSLLK
jgi:VanZ family protein